MLRLDFGVCSAPADLLLGGTQRNRSQQQVCSGSVHDDTSKQEQQHWCSNAGCLR